MNKEEAIKLAVPCDKNTIWEKIKIVVNLWAGCIDHSAVGQEQIDTFCDLLTGYTIVEHDKGEHIKLFKEYGVRPIEKHSILMKALNFSGISVKNMNEDIKRVTIYPNGALKVEYTETGKATRWL